MLPLPWLARVTAALVLIACATEADLAPGPRDRVTFEPRPGWAPEVGARTVGDGVIGTVPRVQVGDDERIYLLRLEERWGNLHARDIASALTVHAPDGSLQATIGEPGDVMLDFVIHPGGEVTTLALRESSTSELYHLVLARHDRDGHRQVEQYLRDDVAAHDRRAYTVAGDTVDSELILPLLVDGSSVITETMRFYFQPDYRLTLIDGTLYLTAFTYGLRLFRLSEALVPVWSRTILPISYRWFLASQPSIAADRDGTVWVTALIDDEMARIHDAHFGATLRPHPDTTAVLLSRFDAESGAPAGTTVVASPALERAIGLRVEDGVATVVGHTRIRKYDRPNDTTEWDVFVARASLDATLDHRTIDVQQEDLPRAAAFLDTGEIVVVGTFDFVQVDTNSWVDDGAGMVLALAADGTLLHTSALSGPRHVEATACAVAGDTLYLGGHLDGYITHTCDGDPTGAQCHSRAFLGRLDLGLAERVAPRLRGEPGSVLPAAEAVAESPGPSQARRRSLNHRGHHRLGSDR